MAKSTSFDEEVVTRYAYALFRLAEGRSVIDETYRELNDVIAFVKSDADILGFFTSPLRMPNDHLKAVEALLQSLHITGLVGNFLKLLCVKRRLGALVRIGDKFQAFYNKNKGIRVAKLTVAKPAAQDFVDEIAKTLFADRMRDKVEIDVNVDTNILGGFIVYYDNKRIDISVRNKLNMLCHAMKEAL